MDWQETVMNKEQVRIWDKELPSFFKEEVFCPEFELETYGLKVAEAQAKATWAARQSEVDEAEQRGIRKVVEWVEKHWDDIKTYIIDVKDWQAFLRTITKRRCYMKIYLGDEVDIRGFAPTIVLRAKRGTLTCTEEGGEVSVEGYTVEVASLEELVELLKEQKGCLVLLECTFPGVPLAVDPYYSGEA